VPAGREWAGGRHLSYREAARRATTRGVSRSLRALLLGAAALGVSCSAPQPAATSVSLVSESGLLDADVHFEGPVVRGNNQLFVALRARSEPGEASLTAVDASMPAHGHEAHAESIVAADDGFRVSGLNLFMTGRWQVSLALTLGEQPDSATLPVDVP
jgi:hypothetical protein